MSRGKTDWQRKRDNEKKRLNDYIVALDRFLAGGDRPVLKKEPTMAMVIHGDKYKTNTYDFYHGTLSPVEQERRRREYNAKQREQNKKDALATNGKYKGTGEQVISKTQEQEEYFKLDDDAQQEAHKKYQVIRDVQRGWRCPMCKNMVPDLVDLSHLEREDFIEVPMKSKSGDTTYPFVFHKACHAKYKDYESKRKTIVHSVNTPAKMLERFLSWGKDGVKEPIVINDDKVVDKSN